MVGLGFEPSHPNSFLFKSYLKDLFLVKSMCVYLSHVYDYAQRPEEGVRSPRAVVTGGCEPSDVDAAN